MAIIVIPARLDSKRLPNKLLLDRTGKPLIVHTLEQALKSKLATKVVVASEDDEILVAVCASACHKDVTVLQPSIQVLKTPQFNTGTERVAYVVRYHKFNDNIIINWQGDEPELDTDNVDALIENMDDNTSIATLATKATLSEMHNPNVVKVVTDNNQYAIYFSRSPIPYEALGLKHVGIYGFTRSFLLNAHNIGLSHYPSERLEQLAWLANGCKIKVLTRDIKSTGIDTADDYEVFVARHSERCRLS